jgi:exonuclease VII small subunit
MEDGENRISQEDCNEDSLGPGILTLTNKRLAFDKTKSRIMDFTKQMGETVLDVPLEDVIKTWKEGLLMKKVCFTAKIGKEEQTYKFGVFNTKGWLKTIEKTIEEKTKQKDSQ